MTALSLDAVVTGRRGPIENLVVTDGVEQSLEFSVTIRRELFGWRSDLAW
jgi:hypothetical protein